ncbi:MAG: hypothetical protein R3281_00715 [Balneolaceae bacterium]|nr:hypothetical protein [Balneolaceae bacterium]
MDLNTTVTRPGHGSRYSAVKFLVVILFLAVAGLGCEDQKVQTVRWTEYEPVYMTQQEFRESVGLEEPRTLGEPGKIYFYDNYLFVNEVNKGVHVIDNSSPSSPRKVGFINIPANKDIAVSGNLLYADSNSDLLVFDITDMEKAELVKRIEDVFTFSANRPPAYPAQPVDHARGIVVDWKEVEVQETCRGDCHRVRPDLFFTTGDNLASFSAEGGANTPGIGGSMARFAITGDYLYTVDDIHLTTFDISSPQPAKVHAKEVGWRIETIFPNDKQLYIGSASAMYIFDISNPAVPSQMSVYTHLTACDPVVVEGTHAFVTLRQSERCPRGVNRLEVVDVSDPFNPQKVAFYEMISPHGLGIDNGNLFVSEGAYGLKILDATDPAEIQLLRHIRNIETYDVIPYNNVLMVTGQSGILQYDYSNIENLKLLSEIPITGS